VPAFECEIKVKYRFRFALTHEIVNSMPQELRFSQKGRAYFGDGVEFA